MLSRHPTLLTLAFAIACGGRQPQAGVQQLAAAQLTPEQQARCTAINDSIFANVSPEALPEARMRPGKPPNVRPPLSALRQGIPIGFAYLVRPDGTSDTGSVTISGTDNGRFRNDVVRYARRNEMAPAEIDGCPVWSRVGVNITPMGIERVRRP